jgi:long-chain fatty acid transport protein
MRSRCACSAILILRVHLPTRARSLSIAAAEAESIVIDRLQRNNQGTEMRIAGFAKYLMLHFMASIAPAALAANGAQLTANGPAAAGMGGVSIALPQDAAAAADNPAGMAEVGTRLDLFGSVIRAESRSSFGAEDNSHVSHVVVPALGLGFNYQFNRQWTFGVSVTGAGLAADYGEPVLPVPGAGEAKANLAVVNTSPTVTYKPTANLALGASTILGLQQFRSSGVVVGGPGGVPIALPGHGNSWAKGVSAAVGALWHPLPTVTLGASYFSETKFSALSGYKDDLLIGSGGRLNSPGRYGVGIAVRPIEGLTIGLDYLKILWGRAEGYNEPIGFNWRNQNVYRIGVAYRVNDKMTVRTGFSHASSHLDSNHTLANFYANGITNRALTAGVTYELDKSGSLVAAFEYDIPRTLRGTGVSKGTNISTNFQVLTLGYSYKF